MDYDKRYKTKRGLPSKLLVCRGCYKKIMKLYDSRRDFISGVCYYWKCHCGCEDRRIL